jgi:L-lactate dehydrogenase complex protein LldE
MPQSGRRALFSSPSAYDSTDWINFMQVGLFITCLADSFMPRIGAAVVAVLRHYGCDVRFPAEQTCCGQPAYNNGLTREAAGFVSTLARVFEEDEYVVTPSASCGVMVKVHGPELFEADDEAGRRARALAGKLHEFGSFITEVLGIDLTGLMREAGAGRVACHYPCHTRGLATAEQVRDRARMLSGSRFTELRRFDQCCGFGGAFSMEYSDISGAMLGDKLDAIAESEAQIVLCDETGCRMNIEGGLHRRDMNVRVMHTAEWMAEALELALPGEAR